jgi:hypothetical protein
MTTFSWLIESPGPHYLRVLGSDNNAHFQWATDANKAIRFYDRVQADAVYSALRAIVPTLFAFEAILTNAKPVEHGFLVSAAIAQLEAKEKADA